MEKKKKKSDPSQIKLNSIKEEVEMGIWRERERERERESKGKGGCETGKNKMKEET